MKWLLCFLIGCWVLLIRSGAVVGAPTSANRMVCAEYVARDHNSPAPSDTEDLDDTVIFTDVDDSDESSDSYTDSPPAAPPPPPPPQQPAGVVQCSAGQQFCYSVWKLDAIGNATIIRQGCWQSDERQSACQSERCVSGAPNSVQNSHRFCCCSGSMCNQNTTIIEAIRRQDGREFGANEPVEDDDFQQSGGPFTAAQIASLWRSPLVWTCLAVSMALAIGVGAMLALTSGKKYVAELTPLAQAQSDADTGAMGPGYCSTAQCVDNLRLAGMIGRGRYGKVWKGEVNEREVAVKIFPAQHRQYFLNERNIYSLDLMDTPCLLEYFGCDTRRTMNGELEHLLVLSLAPQGCLQDWLIANTASFAVFTRMAKSVIRGLSHLHTELRSGDREKPCVVHRDFNTRNILVKADLSCCIADFGFALKMYGSRYEWKGEVAMAETKSVAEVGTLRYMAPEVLEGAVNLRECETALKQIDVYALGLVLWELCTRCADWYPAATVADPPPAYMAPYEAEVGKHPSFEHMQILVSRHKVRPAFPATWGGAAASARLARETCEDCWDHDSEARLTALCAEERMNELSVLGPTAQSSRPISPSLSGHSAHKPATPNHHGGPGSADRQQSTIGPASLYQSNVTTAIITPPNQIIPQPLQLGAALGRADANGQLSRVVTITARGDYAVLGDKNPNHYGQEGANSVEELLSSSASASCDSVIAAGVGGGAPPDVLLGSGGNGSRHGWYGVRALIQKNLFKRGATGQPKRDTLDRAAANLNVHTMNSAPDPGGSCGAPALAVQLRPRNLGLEQQRMPVAQSATLPRTAAAALATNCTADNVTGDQTVSCTRINYSADIDDDRSSLALCTAVATNLQRPPRIVISKSATTVLQPMAAAAAAAAETRLDHDGSLAEATTTCSLADQHQMKRQRSLEMFHEVFGAKGSIERLRDPAHRVKTPGDVPAAVRRMRASKTLSLYDDRMMQGLADGREMARGGGGGGAGGGAMEGKTSAEASSALM